MGSSTRQGSRYDLAMTPQQLGAQRGPGALIAGGEGLGQSLGSPLTSVFAFLLESPPGALVLPLPEGTLLFPSLPG